MLEVTLTELIAALIAPVGGDRARLIDELVLLERCKGALAARQARVTDAFAVAERTRLAAFASNRDDDTREAQRSVAAQVALARRDSPHRGARHVRLARALVRELPGVLSVLQRGETSEWRAAIVARETAHLSPDQRATIDTAICGDLPAWGDARTEREVRARVLALEPQTAADRAAAAAAERRVTIRPGPDCTAYLTAQLPVREAMAVYGALHRRAGAAAVDPDDHRTRGQVMADTLVSRVLTPGSGQPIVPDVEIQLVMTDRTLLDGNSAPGHVTGYGPVPAPLARQLARGDRRTRVWVRRLYADPTTGTLVTCDARRREFPQAARRLVIARDQFCRTPWCGAPIRHLDHAVAISLGGASSMANGNGRCAACNLSKDLPGWATLVDGDVITTRTPTGHRYSSRPPRPPTSGPWTPDSVAGDSPPPRRPRVELYWVA